MAAIFAAVCSVFLFTTDADAAPNPDKIETWTLASGKHIQASIVSYSRHQKIITLALPSGNWVHVATRDLNGPSKIRWLTSDAFIQSLSSYSVPEGAKSTLFKTFAVVGLSTLLALFLAFWVSVSFIKGNQSLPRAAITFLKITGISLLILGGACVVHWCFRSMFTGTTMENIAISAILGISLALILYTACRFIGHDYGASTGDGFSALGLMVLFFVIGTLVTVIGLPRVLNQPGIDEWFTEQVLTPLELA